MTYANKTRPGHQGFLRKTEAERVEKDSRRVEVKLMRPHVHQMKIVESEAKRTIVRAGRRSGKTIGFAIRSAKRFLEGGRVLYGVPTTEQLESWWWACCLMLSPLIERGLVRKNESTHTIEVPGTKNRLRGKTVWDADTLRGDYGDLLILDEWQLCDETAWSLVGAPMLLDTGGVAMFGYTPPSLRSRSRSKAKDPRHAAKLFKKAMQDKTGKWSAVHFTSFDNPHLNREALTDISADMSATAIRQELHAEDLEDAAGALWSRAIIDRNRVDEAPPLVRMGVAIDPAATSGPSADDTGIVFGGIDAKGIAYVLGDRTCHLAPNGWAKRAVRTYHTIEADAIIGEVNNGGDMVEETVMHVDSSVNFEDVRASRGKIVRADPVAAIHSQDRIKFVGTFPELEDQMCLWEPGMDSPDNMDAFVWLMWWLFKLGNQKDDGPKTQASWVAV